jgi:hypothetical protein
MKSHFMQIVLTAGLIVLGSLTLSAQDKSEIAQVPFAFHAYGNSFAAGGYRVDALNSTGLFQIISRADGRSIFLNAPHTLESSDVNDPHLTFACYAGDCVLKEIWMRGSNVGYARSDGAVDTDMQRKLSMAAMVKVRLTH